MAVRVTIDGQTADIFDSKEFPIRLDFQIESTTNPGARKGSGSSRTYKLPGTPTNSKIFEIFDRVTQVDASGNVFGIKTIRSCTIEVDNVPVLVGKVRLIKVVQDTNKISRKGSFFEVAFLSGNSDWFEDLNGVTMRDIDWSDLDHELNPANIVGGWNADPTASDFGYTLIKWRNWIAQSIGQKYISYEDHTPFLWATTIVERAFEHIGYTITDNDLESADLNRVMTPVPLKNYDERFFDAKVNVLADIATPIVHVADPSLMAQIIYDNEIQDNGSNYDPVSSIFNAPYNGSYRIKFDATLTAISGAPTQFFDIRIRINGLVFFPSFTQVVTILNGEELTFSAVIDLNKGDVVEFFIEYFQAIDFTISSGSLQIDGVKINWVAEPAAQRTDVFWEFLVEDWELLGYIKGLVEMFNLYIFADSATREVVIKTRNNYHTGNEDWQDKLDYSKQAAKQLIFPDRFIRYSYQNDDRDDTVTFLNDTEPFSIYTGVYESSNASSEGVTEFVNSFFAPTIHIKDKSIAGFDGTDTPPQIPLIWPENFVFEPEIVETDYVFKPRVLWHHGTIMLDIHNDENSLEGSISFLASGVAPGTRSNWPKSFMVDYDDQTGTRKSLSYSEQVTSYGVTVPGLVEVYFLQQLAAVNRGVQAAEWVNLKITDILKEDFTLFKVFNNSRHVLQKIESFRPEQIESTKCIFLEDVGATDDDADRLTGNQLKGLIDYNG